jgi:hypothetical protein
MLEIFAKISSSLMSPVCPILSVIIFVCCIATQNTFAVTFTVTRSDDRNAICASGVDCSLREAVSAANAAATNDTINFAAGLTTVTLASGDTGDIVIQNNGSLTISGPGANVLTIDGGAGINRIFYTQEAIVNIFGVTLEGGNGGGAISFGSGGAILAFKGTLALDSVVVRNNGGDSILGGGVYFILNSNAIINSTFSNNFSSQCGAFSNASGTLAVTNSTISGNTANFFSGAGPDAGGGFCNGGGMNLRNSTVTNNSATTAGSRGGGIYNFATLGLANTIIAGNTATNKPEINNLSAVISFGNNIIGDSAGDSADTGSAITYQSSDILDTPPLLGALQNNGGMTQTHALLAGSPAIDKGRNLEAINLNTNTALANDQRGFARIVDGNGNGTATVDIGAFEVQLAPTAADVTVGGRVQTAKGIGIARARVTMTGSKGEIQTAISDDSGYFQFTEVNAGETYVFAVIAKQYHFVAPIRIVTILQTIDDLDFSAAGNRQKF